MAKLAIIAVAAVAIGGKTYEPGTQLGTWDPEGEQNTPLRKGRIESTVAGVTPGHLDARLVSKQCRLAEPGAKGAKPKPEAATPAGVEALEAPPPAPVSDPPAKPRQRRNGKGSK